MAPKPRTGDEALRSCDHQNFVGVLLILLSNFTDYLQQCGNKVLTKTGHKADILKEILNLTVFTVQMDENAPVKDSRNVTGVM